jgi:hypothetical protein
MAWPLGHRLTEAAALSLLISLGAAAADGQAISTTPSATTISHAPVPALIGRLDAVGRRDEALEEQMRDRPRNRQVAARSAPAFRQIPRSTIAELGGWRAVQTKPFEAGGVFDTIERPA